MNKKSKKITKFSDQQSETEAETLTSEQLDDLNSCLNVLLDSVKNDTTEFPPIDLLEEVKQCLECLAHTPAAQHNNQRAKFVSLSWPTDLRIIVCRLFRTFKIPEEYILVSYELCNFATQSLGAEWLKGDAQFLRLLASLSGGRLRIILGQPSQVDLSQLIACVQLQEFFLRCVEDEQEWMGDEDATFVAKCCQESATFVCEYLVECARQGVNIHLYMELFLVLYRYVCAFLAIGGAEILDQGMLDEALPVPVKVCEFCLTQRDHQTAWFLLFNLPHFRTLPNNSLALLVEHTGLVYATKQRQEALTGIASVVEQLLDKKGWYRVEALENAEQLAKAGKDQRLLELLQMVRNEAERSKNY